MTSSPHTQPIGKVRGVWLLERTRTVFSVSQKSPRSVLINQNVTSKSCVNIFL